VTELTVPGCELCQSFGGRVLWRDALVRVVAVDEPGYPGFCRVVLNRHMAEMTDLAVAERDTLMRTVFAVESALRAVLAPDKINLASLGNQVPHLHWHVIPRFRDDPHFPGSVWSAPRREAAGDRQLDEAALGAAIAARLGPGSEA
jgi:diadenosine tetraphosphate (Ap4A) HIT family hydrolase